MARPRRGVIYELLSALTTITELTRVGSSFQAQLGDKNPNTGIRQIDVVKPRLLPNKGGREGRRDVSSLCRQGFGNVLVRERKEIRWKLLHAWLIASLTRVF